MSRKYLFLLPVVAALGAAGIADAQSALRYTARNGMTAVGTAQQFEVLSKAATTENDYFCAAGSFARNRAGAATNDRVVVTRSMGSSLFASGRRSVVFTVAGPEAKETGGSGSFLNANSGVGKNASVGHSISLCEQSLRLSAQRR